MATRAQYWVYEGGFFWWPGDSPSMRYSEDGVHWTTLSREAALYHMRQERFGASRVGFGEFLRLLTSRVEMLYR